MSKEVSMQLKQGWHNLTQDDALKKLQSRAAGLNADEVAVRLAEYGPNVLETKKKPSIAMMFLRQFLSPLVYVLIFAALIKFAVGGYLDGIVILSMLLLMAFIGFIQEAKAEKAMEALIQLASPKAKVKRGGDTLIISAKDIVPGDIIILEAGDKVPADARLINASNLKVNESSLTGESMPVDKHTDTLHEDVSIADRKNLVFFGTIVMYGRASAVVISTGMQTEIGKIAHSIQDIKPEKTPLQKSIQRLGNYIIILVLGACVLLIASGLIRGLGWIEIFLLAVAAAVSAIPEGLPAVVTVVLAVGMRLMARRNAIIRRLVAVETLGSTTVICSDKTGTLTLNQMTVKHLYINGQQIKVTGEGYSPKGQFYLGEKIIDPKNEEPLKLFLNISALCNDALLTGEKNCCGIVGDPTEGALLILAAKSGLSKEEQELIFPRIDEIPFQSEKQYMATLHAHRDKRRIYIKGSFEKLISFSKYIFKDNQAIPLEKDELRSIMQASEGMAKNAMRVIAGGYVDITEDSGKITEEDIRGKVVFAGLAGMADPPREDAKEAIKLCKQAGIKVVMVTGDNKVTAESIARQLDLAPGRAISGTELGLISDEDLLEQIEKISVFARIEPLHKLRIVKSFKDRGHIVAMTGDGINDAPALKTANIGIAMGKSGTDVAKEASDMVLTDDNFSSIVAAIEEGRAIFNRLRNVVFFTLSTCFGELLALILSVLFIGKAPLLALQIIWVNLVTGTVMSIPLGLEPKVGDELKHEPRSPKVGIIFPGLLFRIGFLSAMLSVAVFMVFKWAYKTATIEHARTMAFCTMVTFEWFIAFNARSDEHTIWKLGIFKNRWLIFSTVIAIVLQLSVVYIPFIRIPFKTVPLNLGHWLIIILITGTIFILENIRKAIFPKLFSFGKWK